MDSRVAALSKVGPSLADLLMDVFCFVASPSFKGAADLVDGARRKFSRARQVSADLPGGGGDLGGQLTRRLAERVASVYRECRERNVDSSYLAIAETEVQILIAEATDEDLVVLSAVRDPEGFEEFLRRRAAGRRGLIEKEAEPYFDALIRALAAVYVEMAPWSRDFVVVALKSLLAQGVSIASVLEEQGADHQEMRQMLMQIRDVQADILRVIEQLSGGARPGRLLFGGRPDVAFGFRERAEQGRLRGLVVDGAQERAVLVGMAGCGKSQLASSLAQWCGAAGWGLVAWLNASSAASVRSDLVELARRLGVDMGDNPTQDQAVRRCLDHLQSAEAGDRLVVFDNVKRIEDVAGVVPRGGGLRVVATTRSGRGWRAQGWERVGVGVFPREDSIAYLLDATGSQDAETADAVAGRLGDLPLAVAQAAATASNEGWTLRRYLERLEKYSSRQVIRPVPGDSYTRDVSSALRMAVDSALGRIDDRLRGVARLQIGALAVLAESGVPTRWVDPRTEDNKATEGAGADETNEDTGAGGAGEDADARDAAAEKAHLALTALLNASVVQQTADGGVTMLHRLQGQVLRENWNREEWAGAFDAAADLLDRVDIGSLRREDAEGRRRQTRDLIEQLRAIAAQDYSRPLFERERVVADLPHALLHARDLGLPNEALTLRGAVGVVEEILGAEHPDSLASRNGLAGVYWAVGRLGEAITLFEEVAADCARVLGPDHPQTLASRNNLAGAYESAGRLGEAIVLYEGVLADSVRVLGPDHPHTLTSRNNLAGAYESVGRLGEAIPLYEGVLADSVRVLGEDDPDTLASRNNLAGAYQAAGRLDEAIPLYEGVLADRVRVLGADHPDTLTSRNNLAHAYQAAGRLGEAIPLYEEVLADRARVLGADHPQTLASRNNLAYGYYVAGRLDEAIPLYEEELADSARVLGADHPQTLASRNNLAGAYYSAGRLGEAIPLLEEVLADRARVLGDDHPGTLTSRNNLAGAYESAGRLGEAIALYEGVLADSVRVLGEDDPGTLTSRNNLAVAYYSAGRLGEAIPLLEEVLADRARVLGYNHPDTLAFRNNLAYAYYSAGRLGEAIPLFEGVFADRRRVLGADHPDTLTSRNNLAHAYQAAGRHHEAITLFKDTLEVCEEVLSPGHPLTTRVRKSLETLEREMNPAPASSPESSDE